jgi:RNA polymerase sigma factor for flagellar operon FliA
MQHAAIFLELGSRYWSTVCAGITAERRKTGDSPMPIAVAIEAVEVEYDEARHGKESAAELARRNQVVLDHLPLVKSVARRLRATLPDQAEFNDLMQAGTLGLIDAAKKFDPDKGFLFKTYASHRIRGAMLDGLRQCDWASRRLRLRQNQIEAATHELTAELHRPPSELEMAEKMGMSLADWRELALTVANFKRVHASSRASDDDSDLERDLPGSSDSHPDWIFANEQMNDIVRDTIERLPERQRTVVLLHYKGEKSMKEIGGLMGTHESRASQVHRAALTKMAEALKVKGICSSQPL